VSSGLLPLLARTGVILGVGVALGVAVNGLRPHGLRPSGFAVATTCTAAGPPSTGISVLPPEQAVRLCGDPGVLIADVRSAERFAEGHVAQAIHLPCAARQDAATGALARVEGAHTVVMYGDSTEEATPVAESLRRRLPRADLRLVVIEGGFAGWDRAGLACSSGPCPDCREQARNRP
jgi:rhodanese-related sulfurtransferase